MTTYLLKLYITGQTPRTTRAIDNIYKICEAEMPGNYQLVIIDILERPQIAEDEKILATPTLVKVRPGPVRRVIGDLSNKEKVISGLDLVPNSPTKGVDNG